VEKILKVFINLLHPISKAPLGMRALAQVRGKPCTPAKRVRVKVEGVPVAKLRCTPDASLTPAGR
jgi:hypothetical protein